jgi:subtilase family serine protease
MRLLPPDTPVKDRPLRCWRIAIFTTRGLEHFPERIRIIQLHFGIVQHNQSRATERKFQLFRSGSRIRFDDVEATLDAEWASAAAPDATIEVAACADTATTFGG